MYEELVNQLRELCEMTALCDDHICFECPYEEKCSGYKNGKLSAVYRQSAEAIEKFQDYMKAEVEGRMVILPVKEGTPLYVDGKIFAAHCKGEIHEVKDWYYSFPMIYKDFRGEHDYVIDPDSIGNSVFLTREEAEENLAKGES